MESNSKLPHRLYAEKVQGTLSLPIGKRCGADTLELDFSTWVGAYYALDLFAYYALPNKECSVAVLCPIVMDSFGYRLIGNVICFDIITILI